MSSISEVELEAVYTTFSVENCSSGSATMERSKSDVKRHKPVQGRVHLQPVKTAPFPVPSHEQRESGGRPAL